MYWMARELSELSVEDDAGGQKCTIQVRTKFPTENFTLAMRDWAARRVQVNGRDLRKATSRRDFRSERFLVEGKETFIAFNLEIGGVTVVISR